MLLERIEINTRGPLGLVQLGPFSPGLNAILGPVTCSHTAISAATDGCDGLPVISFLRALMLGARASQTALGGWSGRIVWADAEGLLHCRRELDGTAEGRLAVDFEARAHAGLEIPSDRRSSSYLRRRLAQLPPSIIDAVIAQADGGDALFTVLRATDRSGLDAATEGSSTLQPEQLRLVERLQAQADKLQQQIDTIPLGEQTIGQLNDRRDQLQAELESQEQWLRSAREQHHAEQTRRRSLEHRLQELREEARRLRDQEAELRRSLTDIEAAMRTISFDSSTAHPRVAVAEAHRRQLEDLDSQLIRWRRTLAEVRGMCDQLCRDTIADGDDAALLYPTAPGQWDARLEAAQRQIDWLTIRYAYGDPVDDASPSDAASETQTRPDNARCGASELTEQLSAIKGELGRLCTRLAHDTTSDTHWAMESARSQLQRCESELLDSIARLVRQRHRLLRRISQTHRVPTEQLTTAFGDWSHCQDHPHLYQWLLSEGGPTRGETREANETRVRRLEADRAACSHELDRTVNRLENCLAEIEVLGKQRQQQLDGDAQHWSVQRREAILAELASVRARLSDLETRQQWIVQRDQCRHQIRQVRPAVRYESALARRASHWLTQLSGGRLRSIEWDKQAWHNAACSTGDSGRRRGDVRVDGVGVSEWSASDRSLASLAIRMAAADALAQRGHHIPLLIEAPVTAASLSAPRATSQPLTARPVEDRDGWEIADHRAGGQRWQPAIGGAAWIDALIAFADRGRQLVLLTADRRLADRVANAGGRVQSLAAHAYAVPRSIYAYRSAPPALPSRSRLLPQINRDLDTAWREAYGFYDDPAWFRAGQLGAAGQADERDDYRDGAYLRSGSAALQPYTPPMTTADDSPSLDAQPQPLIDTDRLIVPAADERQHTTPTSPFFLTTDSPVEQAPSVDAVAAARLHRLRVTRVAHLLTAEPMGLAAALGMADVTAAVVRRWQHEARLVCQVPQLRGFDARLLVGCGITDPQQLAAMHAGQLLEKVEAFLATDRGRQLLSSGSSYELSRITSWIAAANRSVARSSRHGDRPGATDALPHATQSKRVDEPVERPGGHRHHRRRRRPAGDSASAGQRPVVPMVDAQPSGTAEPRRDFYLDRQSPVVDAPSIGPRTASRLQQIGIHTVDDLLQEEAAQVAQRLASKRIDEQCVRQWQQQATLVCRIPMLRGYEAALLVAVGIHEPERLARCDADQLLSKVRRLTSTAEGKRLLRGAADPGLKKVAAWIRQAEHHRSLRAA